MKKTLLLFFVQQFFFSIISFSQPIPVLQPYLSGFTRPVKATHAYDSRLFIAEIGGKIKVVKNGVVDHNNPFLNISSKMNDLDWAGIFSIVFDPNYQTNGYFYVMYIVKSKFEINISRFKRVGGADSDLADASSETVILTIPYTDVLGGHRGGDMAFGKDNFLYLSTGDNGPGSRGVMGDPELNSQNSNLLFGKIIRLDVNSSNPADNILQKIWAKGLRNPWRISFDRENGDFWYGDNGQDGWEEVNYLKATDVTTPRNFGWDYMEGNSVYRNCNCDIPTSFIAPKFVYPGFTNNGGNSASVMGGYVYRGTKYASLKGSYIFGDYQTFKIGMITPAGFSGFLTNVTYPSLVSFGEDNQGELYAISFFDGTIAQITGPTTPLPVKLENFTAKGSGCSIDLQWSTSFESNFSHFEIERSADGKTFGKIKSIPASGTDHVYHFTDENPLANNNLYRLKMLDNDESYEFSRIISAKIDCPANEISVFPNPTTELVSIKGVQPGNTIYVYNVSGTLILSRKSVSEAEVHINMKNYPNGMYTVNIKDENDGIVAKMKLVKE